MHQAPYIGCQQDVANLTRRNNIATGQQLPDAGQVRIVLGQKRVEQRRRQMQHRDPVPLDLILQVGCVPPTGRHDHKLGAVEQRAPNLEGRGVERGRREKIRKPKSGDGRPMEFWSPNFLGRIYQSAVAGERESRSASTHRLHWRRGHIKVHVRLNPC